MRLKQFVTKSYNTVFQMGLETMKDLYFLLTKDFLVYGITDIESFSSRFVIISKYLEKPPKYA